MMGLGIKVQLIELNALATYLARPIVLGFRTGRGDIAPNGLGGPEGEIRLFHGLLFAFFRKPAIAATKACGTPF